MLIYNTVLLLVLLFNIVLLVLTKLDMVGYKQV